MELLVIMPMPSCMQIDLLNLKEKFMNKSWIYNLKGVNMVEVRYLERQIREIEGFDVDICWPDGTNVRGDYGGANTYGYKRMAPGRYTIGKWIRERFNWHNSKFIVRVKDGNGNIINSNNTRLKNIRETY